MTRFAYEMCEQSMCSRRAVALHSMLLAGRAGVDLDIMIIGRFTQATRRIYWPGHAPLLTCDTCAAWARRVAGALGFELPEDEIPVAFAGDDTARFRLLEL